MTKALTGVADLMLSKIVQFSRLLRAAGVGTTPVETVDAAMAVRMTYPLPLPQLGYVLRTALVKWPEHYGLFERVFREFWKVQTPISSPAGPEQPKGSTGEMFRVPSTVSFRSVWTAHSVQTKKAEVTAAYSPFANLATKQFGRLDQHRGFIVKRSVRSLLRMLATRPGRRYRQSLRGELDLRGMIRRSLGTQGELIHVLHRRRKLSRAAVTAFCDVSGSMEARSEELLMLLHSIQNSVPKAETFVFSTDLVRVSEWLQARSLREAADNLSRRIKVWGSGTRIGHCLANALTSYGHLLGDDTVILIISDGWDLGELDLLAATMRELQRRVASIFWLNPLADEPGFQPGASGLLEVLPFVNLHSGISLLYDRRKLVHRVMRSLKESNEVLSLKEPRLSI